MCAVGFSRRRGRRHRAMSGAPETVRRGAVGPEAGRQPPRRAFLQGQNTLVRATRTSRPPAFAGAGSGPRSRTGRGLGQNVPVSRCRPGACPCERGGAAEIRQRFAQLLPHAPHHRLELCRVRCCRLAPLRAHSTHSLPREEMERRAREPDPDWQGRRESARPVARFGAVGVRSVLTLPPRPRRVRPSRGRVCAAQAESLTAIGGRLVIACRPPARAGASLTPGPPALSTAAPHPAERRPCGVPLEARGDPPAEPQGLSPGGASPRGVGRASRAGSSLRSE